MPTVGQLLPNILSILALHYNGYYIDMVCRKESGHKEIHRGLQLKDQEWLENSEKISNIQDTELTGLLDWEEKQ